MDIHSFYFPRDGHRRHDYEPVAVSREYKYSLTRVHYRGIVLWQGYPDIQDKPCVYFKAIWNTPMICTNTRGMFCTPTRPEDRFLLYGYFIPTIMAKNPDNHLTYQLTEYESTLVNEQVPEESKFYWKGFEYWVILANVDTIEELAIPDKIKKTLSLLSQGKEIISF